MDYTLKLNEAHVAVLIAALEMYGRVGVGEFTTILAHPDVKKALAGRSPALSYNVRMLLDQTVKCLVYSSDRLAKGPRYSLGSPEIGDTNRMAYDMFQVLRNQIALDTLPSEGQTVPSPVSKQPLVTIEKLA